MRELRVAEQRYQAVLAVISDGLSVSQVAEKVRVSRTDPAGPERTIRHRRQFIVRRGHGPGLNSAYSLPLSGRQSAAKRPLQCRRGRLHYANERRSHDAELILDAAWHHTAPSAGRPSVGRGRTEPRPLQIKQRGLR